MKRAREIVEAVSSVSLVPVLFWAGAIWLYNSWNELLSIQYPDPGPLLARWPWPQYSVRFGMGDIILLIPPISVILILGFWIGSRRVRAGGDSESAERILKAQRGVRILLWAWVLVFPVPLLILFAVHPDLVGSIGKMVRAMAPRIF
jgi:hypothetical protein